MSKLNGMIMSQILIGLIGVLGFAFIFGAWAFNELTGGMDWRLSLAIWTLVYLVLLVVLYPIFNRFALWVEEWFK